MVDFIIQQNQTLLDELKKSQEQLAKSLFIIQAVDEKRKELEFQIEKLQEENQILAQDNERLKKELQMLMTLVGQKLIFFK